MTMIGAGQSIPDIAVKLVSNGQIKDAGTGELFSTGRSILFALPGAFTPTCSNDHLPGYVAWRSQFNEAGIDRIVCATANDFHVTAAWAEARFAAQDIDFISDFDASFAKALGVNKFLPLLGERYLRSAFIIENGTITHAFLADQPGSLGDTSAEAVLAVLRTQS